MADLSIDEGISRIQNILPKIAEVAVAVMRDECPKRTGKTADSIMATPVGTNSVFVGPAAQKVAGHIVHGRGEVFPKRKKALHWNEGYDVFAMRSSAVPPNDFVGRTKDRLESMTFTI